jgi:hypothetical protein
VELEVSTRLDVQK